MILFHFATSTSCVTRKRWRLNRNSTLTNNVDRLGFNIQRPSAAPRWTLPWTANASREHLLRTQCKLLPGVLEVTLLTIPFIIVHLRWGELQHKLIPPKLQHSNTPDSMSYGKLIRLLSNLQLVTRYMSGSQHIPYTIIQLPRRFSVSSQLPT